ncbi:protein of unknown function [Micropruina glycogenica]|uniref:Uncharacterized protein n=1 Tax=Micropruina glycogenica TaxID=75385 RepID=A0A2N9JEP1_9ACTN|nr:protein of unknown function [Micropruina glycogenica]
MARQHPHRQFLVRQVRAGQLEGLGSLDLVLVDLAAVLVVAAGLEFFDAVFALFVGLPRSVVVGCHLFVNSILSAARLGSNAQFYRGDLKASDAYISHEPKTNAAGGGYLNHRTPRRYSLAGREAFDPVGYAITNTGERSSDAHRPAPGAQPRRQEPDRRR